MSSNLIRPCQFRLVICLLKPLTCTVLSKSPTLRSLESKIQWMVEFWFQQRKGTNQWHGENCGDEGDMIIPVTLTVVRCVGLVEGIIQKKCILEVEEESGFQLSSCIPSFVV